MKRRFAVLTRIDNNEPITTETHSDFLFHLQSALLMALREGGTISAMQYRYAKERLSQQQRPRRAKKGREQGCADD